MLKFSFKQSLFSVACLLSIAEAKTSNTVLTKYGTQRSHTYDDKGNFIHPFRNESEEITTIHYPDEKKFTIKLSKGAKSQMQQEQHKLQAYSSELNNILNLGYYGAISVGTPQQILPSVGFDTSSGTTMIETEKCINCHDQVFNTNASSTYTEAAVPAAPFESDGVSAKDTFCFTAFDDSCTKGFKFLALTTKGPELDKYNDGMIGMQNGQSTGTTDELFVPSLYNSGSLDYPAFSIYLGQEDEDSFIDFGEPNLDTFDLDADGFEIESVDTVDQWSNFVSGYRFNTEDDDVEEIIGYQRAYLDTSNDCISGPSEHIDAIYNKILSATNGIATDDIFQHVYQCSDIDKLPSFSLKFGEEWMEVTPANYMI